jgi:phosphoglycolate phosphatase-like HAD superfamily hydrolase
MLVIRDAQLEVFRAALQAEFREKLRRHLRGRCPRLNDSDIPVQITLGMAQAKEYGIVREIDVARFIEAVCVYRGGFAAEPFPKPALAILYGYRTDPDARLDRFIHWCETTCPNSLANVK